MPAAVTKQPGQAASPRSGSPKHRGDRAREDRVLLAHYLDTRDRRERDLLVERFLPLARQLARRYQRAEEPFDDLFQVACVGLVKAIERFDPERGAAFSSYAVPTIAGELKRYFRDHTWSVRVPRELQELALRVSRAVAELSLELHRQPTVREIATTLDCGEEDVLDALEANGAYRAASLEAPRAAANDSGETLGDALGIEDRGFALAEDRATLAHLVSSLAAREREVLRLRFEEDLTQSEIGARIGVSQMHVSRIIRQAIAELRSVASTVRSQPPDGLPHQPLRESSDSEQRSRAVA